MVEAQLIHSAIWIQYMALLNQSLVEQHYLIHLHIMVKVQAHIALKLLMIGLTQLQLSIMLLMEKK